MTDKELIENFVLMAYEGYDKAIFLLEEYSKTLITPINDFQAGQHAGIEISISYLKSVRERTIEKDNS